MKKTIGYALGGGGAKGFAQLGALLELEKLNIKPDYLAGTSAGGMNAILLAAGYTTNEIIDFEIADDLVFKIDTKLRAKFYKIKAKNLLFKIINKNILYWEVL